MTRIGTKVKITACALTAALSFSGIRLAAEAETSCVLPGGGVALAMAQGNKLEDIAADNQGKLQIETIVEKANFTAASRDRAAQIKRAEEESFRNLVIAQVDSYVNVRNAPSEKGEIIGKLYDDSVGTFIAEENGWYLISSGSVTGYVKGEFCVTGEDAVELAGKVCTRIATVKATALKVRSEPSLEASVLGLVPLDDDLVVLEETEGWVKVDAEEGIGWVSADYVTLHTEFAQAESKEEEAVRLAKEETERKKAVEAAAAKAAKDRPGVLAAKAAETGAASATAGAGGSEMGEAVVQYALQFVGNPYVYGGSSLTNGTDCSGFVMSVYANFGVSLPHSSAADRTQGYAVDGLENARPGDLVCYSGHVALYMGNGQIVHASTPETGIIVSNAGYKQPLAVRRIF